MAIPVCAQAPPVIVQVDLQEIVHPVSADYVLAGLARAKDLDAQAVVLRLNTPGGLVDSMRQIVEAVLSSPVPVIAWVGPNGGRAASAGFFILLAADVAVMAPGTNTGAAHPVLSTGQPITDVLQKKIVNDAAAYIRSYVSKRGRNAQLAELGVTESRSFTAEEALKEKLIDAVTSDVDAIIQQYDGKEIRRLDDRAATLRLRGARIDKFEMTPRQKALSRILDPNVALILALIGLIGIYVEITHPGFILPGVLGAISFILALFAFNVLPVSWTGAALIVLAIVLFAMEATIASHGILAAGGIVSMVVGGMMLVQGPIPELRIRLSTTLAAAVPVAVITVFLVRLVYLSHQRKSVSGEEGMIGELGVAESDIHNDGRVLVHGEYWNGFSKTPIPKGSRVRVLKMHGLRLEIEAVTEEK